MNYILLQPYMSTIFNTDVSTYTISELMAIANINQLIDIEIAEKTNTLVEKYKNTSRRVSDFYQDIQTKVCIYIY